MNNSRYFFLHFFFDMKGKNHEWRFFISGKIFFPVLVKQRRAERPPRLSVLDTTVKYIFHFRICRIGEYASVAKRSWTAFHAALEPSYYLVLSNKFCSNACNVFVERIF